MSELLTDRLKDIRNGLGLSQAQMALKLGIQVVRYNYYETGKRNPKQDFYDKFQSAFGVNLFIKNAPM